MKQSNGSNKQRRFIVVRVLIILLAVSVIFGLFITPVIAENGTLVWAKAMGGGTADSGLDVAIDDAGNVYITGYFAETVDFDPGPGTLALTSSGYEDIFVSKFDNNGNLIWARQMSGSSYERGTSLAIDQVGNIYITGYFLGTVDFDPGSGAATLTAIGRDIFISKLDSNGNYVWAKKIGGGGDDRSLALALDAANNAFITGFFGDSADFDPGPGTAILASEGGSDIFISKLNENGNYVWAKRIGNFHNDEKGLGLAVDGAGNVLTTGYFIDTTDFDPGIGVANLTSAGWDIFISKLDNNGNYVWAKGMGSDAFAIEQGSGITIDEEGNVYTTGHFYGTVDFDPGPGVANLTDPGGSDMFISKLDSDGNYVWAKRIGGESEASGASIALDQLGNIYITGSFRFSADFDPGSDTAILNGANTSTIFVSKLNKNGGYVWAKQLGNGQSRGTSVAMDADKNVYMTGHFWVYGDFDPSAGTMPLYAYSGWDIFVSKLGASPDITVSQNEGEILNKTGTVNFGTTPLQLPITRTFTISNTGDLTLTLTAPIAVPNGFSVVSGFGNTSVPGNSGTTFQVRLNATSIGSPSSSSMLN